MKTALYSILFAISISSGLNAQCSLLTFDGVNDHVDVGTVVGNGVRTIEMWFKLDQPIDPTLSNFVTLVGREISISSNIGEFNLAFQADFQPFPGTLRFDLDCLTPNRAVYSDNTSWNANQWYHVAAVSHPVDGMMIFIDGVKQISTHPYTGATANSTALTAIGCWGDLYARYFYGSIDDVRFSTDALYSTDFTPPCPDIAADPSTIGLWNFNAASGGTAIDSSSNGYDGEINGPVWDTGEICSCSVDCLQEISAGDDSVLNCLSPSVILSSTSSEEGMIVWTDNNGNIISNSEDVEISIPGVYTLQIEFADGCVFTDEVEVTSDFDVPNSDIIVFNGITTIDCDNTEINISAENVQDVTYNWITPDGNFSTNFVNISTAGIVTLEVVDISSGCISSSTLEITDNSELPNAQIATPDTLTCDLTEITLDGSLSDSGPEYTYQWLDENMQIIVGATNATLLIDMGGNYFLQVLNETSMCESLTQVEVISNFGNLISNAGSDMTLNCINNSMVNLDGTNSSSGADISYNWIDQDGNSIGNSSTQLVTSTGIYTLIVTDIQNACTAQNMVVVNEDLDVPNSNIIANNGTFTIDCDNSEINLSVENTQNVSYSWTSSQGNFTTNNINVSSAGTITLEVIDDSSGCSSMSTIDIFDNSGISDTTTLETTICPSESVFISGVEYTESGTYLQNLTTVGGCDSTLIILIANDSDCVNCDFTDADNLNTNINITKLISNNFNININNQPGLETNKKVLLEIIQIFLQEEYIQEKKGILNALHEKKKLDKNLISKYPLSPLDSEEIREKLLESLEIINSLKPGRSFSFWINIQ